MKLPPLNALPVFEAVARLNSFSRAGEELNVSQSAVSHQIKGLEHYLGEKLFERNGRYLALTEEGKIYLEGITSALLQIERVSGQVLGREESQLRLSVFSSFAVRWLVPRLPDLQRNHPGLELVVEMTSESPVLSDRVADCFITLNSQLKAFSYDVLYHESLFPVCSRQFWQTLSRDLNLNDDPSAGDSAVSADQLAAYPLLSTHSIFGRHAGDWEAWYGAVGQSIPSSARVQHFSHMLLALEAARFHQGISLTNDYMLSNRSDAGDFVRVPCHAFETGDTFYFAYKSSRRAEPGIRTLRRWLISEAIRSGLREEVSPG
ncbi:LysR family transcriptional regulator [Hydrocarboniclastica marina]|uniref:LysR family transcriptional regulator n=1 Tax=Hydrocarboniclastica marina TaxID=2259620 RepID=A0A4V1D915_9ALTE|nr:LysR family transcriptional regulator [Hydrocarboniclastica marina]QCF27110.1 LysR family transcriptional regulator [Hydrocarboniclastica marina]